MKTVFAYQLWFPSILLVSVLAYGPASSALDAKDDGTCEGIAGRDISAPKISIFRVKERAPASEGMYRVSGSVEGVCLAEAGYFEHGGKKEDFTITRTRSFRRFEFEIESSLQNEPEIRAVNVANQSATAPIKAANSEAEWQETYEERYHDLRDR